MESFIEFGTAKCAVLPYGYNDTAVVDVRVCFWYHHDYDGRHEQTANGRNI